MQLEGKKSKQRLFRKCCVAAVVILGLAAIIVYIPFWAHNRFLGNMTTDFLMVTLPEDSSTIGTVSTMGNLRGTSNQCNYVVRSFVVTKLDPPAFQARIKDAAGQFESKGYTVEVYYVGVVGEMAFGMPGGHMFILEAAGETPADWDLRCQ